jgi:hypothetical protein
MSARGFGFLLGAVWLGTVGIATATAAAARPAVEVKPKDSDRRVDVLVDGKPFTSYIYPTSLKKPVLFPIRDAAGALITRGFPMDPRPHERTDHPHHVGLWLNYGDVNGVDFWNNSEQAPETARMGTIVHRKVESAKGGAGQGELVVSADWLLPGGQAVLGERTRLVFRADAGLRSIDRITTLTALGQKVGFHDNKEGMFGLRVARGLELPATKPDIFIDAAGRPGAAPVLDNEGVNGAYRSSEGKTGDDVWGTRGRWVTLSGKLDGKPVTVAMLDHPKNPGHPTYWHARGYGLFAANPLGVKVFTDGKSEMNFTLEPGQSTTFTYRVLILSEDASAERMEKEYRRFTEETR